MDDVGGPRIVALLTAKDEVVADGHEKGRLLHVVPPRIRGAVEPLRRLGADLLGEEAELAVVPEWQSVRGRVLKLQAEVRACSMSQCQLMQKSAAQVDNYD